MKEEKSEEVQGLLEYGEKTAGRLMTPDMLAVLEYLTVAQAIEQVRKSPVAETASVLYVVDDHDHLVGSLPWRRLITADPTTPVGLLRQEEPVSVTPETDQEGVRAARRQVQPGGHPGGRPRPTPAGGDHGRRHH
jgi:magnesium transporter